MSDRPTPETDAGWHPPFSYDIDEDGAYQVAVLANPKHTQGAWVKIEDYRHLERQRDELLEALEMVETYLVERGIKSRGTTGRTLVLPRIRAAIAAVKGGKP